MSSRKRAIDKIYKRRDRYEIPEWQREEVWSRSKKQNLIDTILRGWKLPKFYFLQTSADPESFEVVDGQQRLTAIFEFYDGDLVLAEDVAKEFGGEHFSEMNDTAQDAFDDYEIEFDVIDDASEEDIKKFFQRLQDGLPLTSSEKLNSIHSKLRDFLNKKSKHAFFEKVTASDKRYGHFDILAKVAALEIDGIDSGLRYDDLRALFESQASFSARSNVAKRLGAALDFANSAFTKDQAALLRNRTVVQAVLTLICCLQKCSGFAGSEAAIGKFFELFLKELARQVELGQKATDPDYLAFQRTVNANVKSGARTRQEVLIRKLLAHDPTFSAAFDGAALAEVGAERIIRSKGAELGDLVNQANEKYAAIHGTDLFKPTNKTVNTLLQIANPVRDEQGYESLVDNLYFLVHEGPGDRLSSQKPPTFADVNTLRTDLRHDVDHGKAAKVRGKRKKSGSVFKKYSGSESRAGLPPERFTLVQINLLTALCQDLRSLVAQL